MSQPWGGHWPGTHHGRLNQAGCVTVLAQPRSSWYKDGNNRSNNQGGTLAGSVTLFFSFITLEPRVERYTSLCALNTSPPRSTAVGLLPSWYTTQGPSWGYLKSRFQETLSIFGDECPQSGSKNDPMAPRTTLECPREGPSVAYRPGANRAWISQRWWDSPRVVATTFCNVRVQTRELSSANRGRTVAGSVNFFPRSHVQASALTVNGGAEEGAEIGPLISKYFTRNP